MGSTFSGLMFYNKDKRDIQSIQDTISGFTFQLGLRPVNPGEEAAKTLRYFVDEAGGWITISGDVFEFENLKQSKKICGLLSQTAKSPALAYGVFDSDVCIIDFCDDESGKSDRIVMDEGYANQEEFGYSIKSTRGKYSVWQSIFPDLKKEEFNAVISGDYVFAEDQLSEFLALLNTGVPNEDSGDYKTLSLTYREGFQPDYEILKKGFPVLDIITRVCYLLTDVKAPARNVISFINRGGPSKGVILFLESPQFENDAIEFSEITIERLNDFNVSRNDRYNDLYLSKQKSIFVKTATNGKFFYIARFNDFSIPEGIIINKYNAKTMDIQFDYQFHFRFDIKSTTYINKDIQIGCIPIENPNSGYIYPRKVNLVTQDYVSDSIRNGWHV